MLKAVAVAPQVGSEHDTYCWPFAVRLRLLDATTGEPVMHAYAEKVEINGILLVHPPALERRRVNQFRVLEAWNRRFRADGKEFDVPIHHLRKWRRAGGSGVKLEPTHEYVGEFFDVLDAAEVLVSDGGRVFYPVAGDRWVCVRSGDMHFARRDFVTDRDGILEIPTSFAFLVRGADYTIRFRDHVCLRATDTFCPEALTEGSAGLEVRLSGAGGRKPVENHWVASVGNAERTFADQVDVRIQRAVERPLDETLWVVRRVRRTPEGAQQRTLERGRQPRGIVVHFNSGRNTDEQLVNSDRTIDWRGCSDALRDRANDFVWHPELPHRLLKAISTRGARTTLGYHYLIDRQGTIWLAADESLEASHAGGKASRIPNSVSASHDGPPGSPVVHTFAAADKLVGDNINDAYIGICPIGHHKDPAHHFNRAQHWYLDRLIESIRERHGESDTLPDIPWYQVLGHDELVGAKPDPGAALSGGMRALRGRHGAFS